MATSNKKTISRELNAYFSERKLRWCSINQGWLSKSCAVGGDVYWTIVPANVEHTAWRAQAWESGNTSWISDEFATPVLAYCNAQLSNWGGHGSPK